MCGVVVLFEESGVKGIGGRSVLSVLTGCSGDSVAVTALKDRASLRVLRNTGRRNFEATVIYRGKERMPCREFNITSRFVVISGFGSVMGRSIRRGLESVGTVIIPRKSFITCTNLSGIRSGFGIPVFNGESILE